MRSENMASFILEVNSMDSNRIDRRRPETGSPIPRHTLAAAVERFAEHCAAKSLSPHTLRAYEGDLDGFVEHVGGTVDPATIDRDAIRRYVRLLREDRQHKETSVKRRIATVKVLFCWLEREGAVPLSVFHRMDLSIRLPRRLPRALEAQEMHRLLRVVERQTARQRPPYEDLLLHVIVVILFATGLRVSELVAIRLTDLSLGESAILIRGKGNRERRVYLPGRQVTVVVRRFLKGRSRLGANRNNENLLITRDGLVVSPQYVRQRLRELAARAALSRHVTPHMLRHTAATQLLEAGVDIRFVQRLLGHSSIATTQLYTHVTDVALKLKMEGANTLRRIHRLSR